MANKGTSYAEKDGKNNTTPKQGKVGATDDAAFRGYVNLSLSADDKALFDVWVLSAAFWERLNVEVEAGVQLSLKRDLKSGGYIASGTQRDQASPNAGLVVTARAREPEVALGRLLFCLTILSRKPRWEDTQAIADPDRW